MPNRATSTRPAAPSPKPRDTRQHSWSHAITTITFRIEGHGLSRVTAAIDTLAGTSRQKAALRRALNHTGDKAYTLVRRELSMVMGLKQADLQRRGLSRRRANSADMMYQIVGRGGFIPLKDFAARPGVRGVSAAPWGVRRMFKGTFIVGTIGGNVFKRVGKKRLPIEKLWGPAIPREMVREAVSTAFYYVAETELPARVEHEVRILTNGVF